MQVHVGMSELIYYGRLYHHACANWLLFFSIILLLSQDILIHLQFLKLFYHFLFSLIGLYVVKGIFMFLLDSCFVFLFWVLQEFHWQLLLPSLQVFYQDWWSNLFTLYCWRNEYLKIIELSPWIVVFNNLIDFEYSQWSVNYISNTHRIWSSEVHLILIEICLSRKLTFRIWFCVLPYSTFYIAVKNHLTLNRRSSYYLLWESVYRACVVVESSIHSQIIVKVLSIDSTSTHEGEEVCISWVSWIEQLVEYLELLRIY